MALSAAQIKNLFIFNLRNFSLEEIEKLWNEYMGEFQSTNEWEFLLYLRETFPERFKNG